MVLGLMGDWWQGIQSLLQSHLCLTHARNFMARTVHCIKLEKEAEGLDFAPYPGELFRALPWRVGQTHLGKRQQGRLGRMVETPNHAGE